MTETVIEQVEFTTDILLNKSLCIYGGSGSGKTTIITNILDILRKEVDQIVVFCPSDPMNKSYSGTWGGESGICPKPLIHTTLTGEILEAIWTRQEMLAAVYNRANNLTIISKLFQRLNLVSINKIIQQAEIKKAESISIVKKELGEAGSARKVEEIKKKYDDFILLVYKKQITIHRNELLRMDLTPEEKHCLKYMNFNPQMVIIFDDCTEQYATLSHEGKSILSSMFYKNRWAKLTVLLVAHDDKALPSELRKNAFMTICTSAQAAITFFGRNSNSFPSEIKKQVSALARIVYAEGSHKKIAFLRTTDSLGVVEASLPEAPFVFGADIIREYCGKIASASTVTIDRSNRFIKYFDATPV